MNLSEKVDKILPALSEVKSKLQAVTKGADNPFFKSKYADLNTHLEAVEPLLQENGMILLQPVSVGLSNIVESRILHVESGQFVSSSMQLVGETDMQKAGSAITYARRYTLGSLLSMKAEDDDGEGSLGRKGKSASSKSKSSANKTASVKKKASFKSDSNTDVGDDI